MSQAQLFEMDKVGREIVMGQQFSLTLTPGLSEYGKWVISNRLLDDTGIALPSWFDFSYEFASQKDADGRTRQTVLNGERVEIPVEYRGKLQTRIGQYLRACGHKVPSCLSDIIGRTSARYSMRQAEVYYDFDEDFEWQDGDFGDNGSCFWSCRSLARDVLRDANAFAIRFYTPDDGRDTWSYYGRKFGQYYGMGRAWVVRVGKGYAIFNAYMNIEPNDYTSGGDTLLFMAQVLLEHLGADYEMRAVNVRNGGTEDGLIWINGGSGYYVGPRGSCPCNDYIELGLGEASYCERCDAWYFGDSYDGWCAECHEEWLEESTECTHCGRREHYDNLYNEDDGAYCWGCWHEWMRTCANCYSRYFDADGDGCPHCE